MPALSALMVFHRDTPFLRPAIASVLNQTFRDLELVLVDNGTRLTPEQLGELGRDPRLRWVRMPGNEGVARAHNAGIAVVRSDIVGLLDSDDIALPSRFEKQFAALQADASVGLISTLAVKIDEEGRFLGKNEFTLPRAEEHRVYGQFSAPLITPATMGRTAVFKALPYRPEFPFASDLDFQMRASECTPMRVLPEVLLHYRWHSTQITQSKYQSLEQSRCAIQLITARRRAGRAEDLAGALQLTAAPRLAEVWRRGAARCTEEGFLVLAAFQARRSFALQRSPLAALHAVRLAYRAWRAAAPAERDQVRRMFLQGPIRALGLHPA